MADEPDSRHDIAKANVSEGWGCFLLMLGIAAVILACGFAIRLIAS